MQCYRVICRVACGLVVLAASGMLAALAPIGASAAIGCADEQLRSETHSNALPDCRSYEMVSPLNKNGAEVGQPSAAPLIQAAAEGDDITYYVNTPIADSPAGNPEEDRVLSTRASTGWTSRDISTGDHLGSTGAAVEQEFFTFSSDLTSATVQPEHPPEAAREPIYIRNNSDEAYEALVTSANVAPSARPEIEQHGALNGRIMGATADGTHVVFSSPDNLTGNAPGGGLFEWNQGQLQFLSELPTGIVAPYTENFGGEDRNIRHAISEDGTHVFWEATEANLPERRLFLRDTAKGSTWQVNAPQGFEEHREPYTPTGGWFQAASRTGSVAIFKEDKRLTSDSTATQGDYDLYAYDAEAAEGQRLTDLTVDEHPGEHAGVRGEVLGASEDGSYVYFVANGVLAKGASPGGCEGEESSSVGATCNLYVAHSNGSGWTTTFIATLSAKDGADWAEGENGFSSLADLTARVSPNGNYLAFMSQEPLTGYANTDVVSGEPDEEVYLYDASTSRLTCVSCNPTGAAPRGVRDSPESELVVDGPRDWLNHRLAGSIPGWSGSTQTYADYQPRYLTDTGRLFFNSPEAYVPQDTNGVEDVYEYEPDGIGGCGEGSASEGVEVYEGGGCLALISGGTGPEESAFADASENGNDVFFITSQALVPEDKDTNFDMYDAHVCSSEWPCLPATGVMTSSPCTTAEACRPGTPQLPVFGTPPSISLSGAGSPTTSLAPAAKVVTKSKSAVQVRADRLKAAIKACKKDKQAKKRAVCEKTARRRHGPKAAKGKTVSGNRGGKR